MLVVQELKPVPHLPPRSLALEGGSLPTDGPVIRGLTKWRLVLNAKRGIWHPPDKLVSPSHLARGLENARDEMALSPLQFQEMLKATAQEDAFQECHPCSCPTFQRQGKEHLFGDGIRVSLAPRTPSRPLGLSASQRDGCLCRLRWCLAVRDKELPAGS